MDIDQKYLVQFAYLFDVFVLYAEEVRTRLEKIQRDFLWGETTWKEKCMWLIGILPAQIKEGVGY